ncbi:MAG: ComEA family DNA-binding protein [Acidobacteriota bacterium]
MRKTLSSICVFVACLPGSLLAGEVPAKVDINTATIAELDTLPGIGPAIAARIIDFRSRHGPFRRVEDLMNVRGIGEKKFLKLKGRIVISLSESQAGKARRVGEKAVQTSAPRRR